MGLIDFWDIAVDGRDSWRDVFDPVSGLHFMGLADTCLFHFRNH
jgi:hypothetical protein